MKMVLIIRFVNREVHYNFDGLMLQYFVVHIPSYLQSPIPFCMFYLLKYFSGKMIATGMDAMSV